MAGFHTENKLYERAQEERRQHVGALRLSQEIAALTGIETLAFIANP
jgi:hypothetical protein